MAKIASTLILVGVIITVQAHPATYEEILSAARERQLDGLKEFSTSESSSNEDFLRSKFADKETWNILSDPASFNSVRDLKPTDGGHVYGEAEYSFHSASNIDGKTTEEQGGHKVINDDGKVKEFDFTPTTELVLQPIINSNLNHGNNDYSAIDYSFHYAPSANGGEPVDYIGGKKIVKTQPPHFKTSTLLRPLPTLIIDENPKPKPLKSDAEDYILVSETEWEENIDPEISINNENSKEIETVPPKTTATPVFLQTVETATLKPMQSGKVDPDPDYAFEITPVNINEPALNIDAQKFYITNETMLNIATTTSTKRPVSYRAYVGVFNPKPVQVGRIYSDVEYIIEPEPAIGNDPFENIKSQKIINNIDEKVAKFEITTSTKKTPFSDNPTRLKEDITYADLDYVIESESATSDEPSESENIHAPEVINNYQNVKKLDTMTSTEKPFHFSPPVGTLKPKVIADQELVLYLASKIDGYISNKVNKNYGKVKVFDITRSRKKTTHSPQLLNGVLNLAPGHGGHVSSESQYSYSHSSSYINGKPVEHHDGHPSAPKSILSPLSIPDVRNLKPPQGGQVYGESQYAYHTASNINGKVRENQGGHKIINNNGQVKEFDFTPSPNLAPVSFF